MKDVTIHAYLCDCGCVFYLSPPVLFKDECDEDTVALMCACGNSATIKDVKQKKDESEMALEIMWSFQP